MVNIYAEFDHGTTLSTTSRVVHPLRHDTPGPIVLENQEDTPPAVYAHLVNQGSDATF